MIQNLSKTVNTQYKRVNRNFNTKNPRIIMQQNLRLSSSFSHLFNHHKIPNISWDLTVPYFLTRKSTILTGIAVKPTERDRADQWDPSLASPTKSPTRQRYQSYHQHSKLILKDLSVCSPLTWERISNFIFIFILCLIFFEALSS